jgi:hypothetical protein
MSFSVMALESYRAALAAGYITREDAVKAAVHAEQLDAAQQLMLDPDQTEPDYPAALMQFDAGATATLMVATASHQSLSFAEKHTRLHMIIDQITVGDLGVVLQAVLSGDARSDDIMMILRACTRRTGMDNQHWIKMIGKICDRVPATSLNFGLDAYGLKQLYTFARRIRTDDASTLAKFTVAGSAAAAEPPAKRTRV